MTIRELTTILLLLAGAAACGSSSSDSATTSPPSSDAPGDDAAAPETSTPSDAGVDGPASDAGAAITGLPNDAWTWVDFPGALCASGTPTGLAVSPHAGATNLLIYFEGGGSCSSGETCWGPSPGATNLTGYDATTFANNPPKVPTLNRASVGNPFADMSMVFVPYCTGDLHSGTTVASLNLTGGGTKQTYFYGAKDVDVFLERLVPTFPGMSRVTVLGASAGGFGTYMNFDRIQTAFGVGVDLIDDSGPPHVSKSSTTNNNALLFGIWGTPAGLPAGCTGCNSLRDVLNYDLTRQATFTPPGQFAFMSFEEDVIISKDFGYDATTDYPALMQTFSASLPPNGHTATFLVTNDPSHVVESDVAATTAYFPWLTQMLTQSPTWTDQVYNGAM